jgi:hypothetical protein
MSRHTIKLGSATVDGERSTFTIEIRLDHVTDKPRQTIDHKRVTEYTELGMTGVEKQYHGSRWEDCGFGQIKDTIRGATFDEDTKVPADVRNRLLDLWDRWHLNGLRSACVHQDKGAHMATEGNRWTDNWHAMTMVQTCKCPNRYHYGQSWLVEPLPAHVIANITDICARYGLES